MKKWKKSLLCVTGMMLLVGCSNDDEKISVDSSDTTSTEESSEKDLETAFLDYMGKDELESWRVHYQLRNKEEEETLIEGELIETDKLAEGFGIEYSYEEILQIIQIYLKQEGIETVTAEQVLEYLIEIYRTEGKQGFKPNIYDKMSQIVSRIEELNPNGVREVSSDEWKTLNQTQKNGLAKQLINRNTSFSSEYLLRYDMEDIPPEILVELVDDYVQVYGTSYHPDVMHYMELGLGDILFAEDDMKGILEYLEKGFNNRDDAYILEKIYTGDYLYTSGGLMEEFFDYHTFDMDLELVEIIKIDPLLKRYYGVVDMTYSFTTNKEKLKEYEEENGEPFPEDDLFNKGKDINNKKVRTLLVTKPNDEIEFGHDILSLYEFDKNPKFVSEFIED